MRARRSIAVWVPFALTLIVAGFTVQQSQFEWNIPAPFPKPPVPRDNPMNAAKVELGRRLFYDTRLSANRTFSCATCHQQALAFTDGKAHAQGVTGEAHPRGAMSLANVAYSPSLTWSNPSVTALEDQALVPMLGKHPVEMGLGGSEARIIATLAADTLYRRLFPRAFSASGTAMTMRTVTQAIAAFERTLISVRSPYDRYRYGGDSSAMSESAKRGEAFFYSGQRGGCFHCHGGWNFNGDVRYDGKPDVQATFVNTGLYNVAGPTSYPSTNPGLFEFTGKREDVGKFRVPTLRNIAVTAPYMHDGSIATLGEVLDHYAAGGRTIASGPNAGVGHDNPNKSPTIHGFAMTPRDKADVIAFLEALTDSSFLTNPSFSNPWK